MAISFLIIHLYSIFLCTINHCAMCFCSQLTGLALEANAEELNNIFARITDIIVAGDTSK